MFLTRYCSHTRTYLKTDTCKFGTLNVSLLHFGSGEALFSGSVLLCSQICSLLRGGIAERGGVRVGHRIIEINNQSVVAVPHEKIVNLLATSVGEVSAPSPGFSTS